MAQILRGLVNVTNGSPTVTGDASALFSSGVPAASIGDLFKVDGEVTFYQISSVDNDTQITLDNNYAGSTDTGLSYTISKDFSTNLNLIRINKGDLELAEILDRNFLLLDANYLNNDHTNLTNIGTNTHAQIDTFMSVMSEQMGKNAVINGDGRIQQRGDYTLVKDAYGFGGDRFQGMATGTAVSAGTLTTVTNASAGTSGFAHKFSGVTLTGTGILYHRHRIESLNAQLYKNKTATLSVKVHHDVGSAKTFTLYVRKANVKDDFSAVTAVANDGGTVISSATASTLLFAGISMGDVSNGIELELKMEVGAITTKNVEITDFQLMPGSIAYDFEYRDIWLERAMCKWYLERQGGIVSNFYANCQCISATAARGLLEYTEKRIVPTITASAAGYFVVTTAAGAAEDVTVLNFGSQSTKTARIDITVAANLVAGNVTRLLDDTGNNSSIYIDAELQ